MAKNYLITQGRKGLMDLELLVLFGFVLHDSKLTNEFLSESFTAEELEAKFKKTVLEKTVEGEGSVKTAGTYFDHWKDRNTEHAGLSDLLEWIAANRGAIECLRKTWKDFQEAKYKSAYGQCDGDAFDFMDLIEAARIIRWRVKESQ